MAAPKGFCGLDDTSGMKFPRHLLISGSVVWAFAAGCAQTPPPPPAALAPAPAEKVYHRAESERSKMLERELERVRADLVAAEEALVAAESGLRGDRSRADAVSALAGAHIQIDRARDKAPWRSGQIDEANVKLAEAESQIAAGNFGAAIFFAWRAERIAERSLEEARLAASEPGVKRIRAGRVNLRGGPSTNEKVLAVLTQGTPVFPELQEQEWVLIRTSSGEVGWVHAALLR